MKKRSEAMTAKTHYSCAELAALKLPGCPGTERGFRDLVSRENWPSIAEKSAGKTGETRKYAPPPALLKQIRAREKALAAVANPGKEQALMIRFAEDMARLREEDAAAQQSRDERAQEQLRMLAGGLSGHEAMSLTAHCEIARGWQVWIVKQPRLKRSNSWDPFANAYNLAEIPVSAAVRAAYPEISPRSAQRWVLDYEKGNFEALVDRRNGSDKKGKNVFTAIPLLGAYAKKILLERPGIRTEQLCALLGTAAICSQTGEVLFPAPSYDQVWRFQTAWIKENHDLYLQATNPDAFKNSVMLAFGSYSDDVTALNQRWEMDATPTDWMLIDEDGIKRRYNVSVIIDIWSRRMIVVVAKTPKTQTHCTALRIALLAWGVPSEIVTDNGQDYQSEHFKRVLGALGITQITRNPFSPEEKPHVERGIGTLNHSMLEILPNFIGHNVAERKAIEARKSFAERLAKRGEVIDFADVVDGACSGEALQKHINTWLQGSYEHNAHGGLDGKTPFARAASWAGEVRRIKDERALDILLARPAGGPRTLQKKGIKIDGAWFISPALASIEMGSSLDIYEMPDLGQVVVYHRGEFLCIAQNAARLGVERIVVAKQADQAQKERIRDERKRVKAETKGLPSTDELLARHLEERAEKARTLVIGQFGQAATTHTSHGLEQAGRAVESMEAPKPSPEHAKLLEEARQSLEAQGINVDKAGKDVHPIELMTFQQRCELWFRQEAVLAQGGTISDPRLVTFQRQFQHQTQFKALLKQRKEQGPSEQQL